MVLAAALPRHGIGEIGGSVFLVLVAATQGAMQSVVAFRG
jgi:hypothetical protein